MSTPVEPYRHPVEVAEELVRSDPFALEPEPPPRMPRWWNPLDGVMVLYWWFMRPDRLWRLAWSVEGRSYGRYRRRGLRTWATFAAVAPVALLVLAVAGLIAYFGATTPASVWAWYMARSLAFGVAVGVVYGVMTGIALGVPFGVVFGVAACVASGVAFCLPFGLAFGMALGGVLGVAAGIGVAGVGVAGLAFAIADSMGIDVAKGVAFDVTIGWGLLIGSLRVLQWGMEIISRIIPWPTGFGRHQRVVLDTAGVLPLPSSGKRPTSEPALSALRSSYRRVQTLSQLRHELVASTFPLAKLLTFCAAERLRASLRLDAIAFRRLRDGHTASLLDGLLICAGGDTRVHDLRDGATKRTPLPLSESLAARICDLFIDKQDHPAFRTARALHALVNGARLDREPTEPYHVMGARLLELLAASRELPDGGDFTDLYETLRLASTATEPSALVRLGLERLPADIDAPAVECVRALRRAVRELVQAAAEVANVRFESGDDERRRRVAAVQRRLLAIAESRPVDMLPHDRKLLHIAARNMGDVLTRHGEALERLVPPRPVVSHYLAGPWVAPDRLIGRGPLLRQIDGLWSSDGLSPWPALVLYGHRRMGKTSLLHALENRHSGRAVIAVVSAQGLPWDEGRASVCVALARAVHRAARDNGATVPAPDPATVAAAPWPAVEALLQDVHERSGRRVVLAIDELEGIQNDPVLLDRLRGLTSDRWWFTPVLAGLHDLTDPFLAHVGAYAQLIDDAKQIPVGLLPEADARALLLQPHPEADLPFAPEALDHLLAEAAGQPYLLQQMGELLVESINARLQRGDPNRSCTMVDAEHACGQRLFREARPYFDGVWEQACEREGAGDLLRALATSREPMSLEALLAAAGVRQDEAETALRHLRTIAVLIEERGRHRFKVPAVRRWVLETFDVSVPHRPWGGGAMGAA